MYAQLFFTLYHPPTGNRFTPSHTGVAPNTHTVQIKHYSISLCTPSSLCVYKSSAFCVINWSLISFPQNKMVFKELKTRIYEWLNLFKLTSIRISNDWFNFFGKKYLISKAHINTDAPQMFQISCSVFSSLIFAS